MSTDRIYVNEKTIFHYKPSQVYDHNILLRTTLAFKIICGFPIEILDV